MTPDVTDTTTYAGYTLQKWTTAGTGTWTIPVGVTSVDYLVVAGGGGGGADQYGGGGGAGGLKTATGFATTPGASVTVTLGAGGNGGTTGNSGSDGGSSVFDSISTTGGGGGGRVANGRAGGSGGGGGYNNEDATKTGGAGTSSEGSAGGSSAYYGGGGGGGKGSVGTNRGIYAPGGSGYDASAFGISNTTTDERYSASGNNSSLAGATWKGQSFTPSFTYTIKKIKLWMKRTGTTVGTVTVQVYATSSNLPTGSVLASGTYNGNNLGTSLAWIEFDLGAGVSLTGSTVYAYTVDARDASGSSADIIMQNNTYTSGKGCQSANSGSTWSNWDSGGNDQDTPFEIWGTHGFIAGGGGGSHGGGAGMAGPGRAGGGYASTYTISEGSAGLANTGGGGGGGSSAATGSGQAGGSGIVVIKYATPLTSVIMWIWE